jgi:hypothetical protein
VHYEELEIFGAFHHSPEHFAQALELIAGGFLKTELLLRQEVRLEALPAHFAAQVDKPFAKAVIHPQRG